MSAARTTDSGPRGGSRCHPRRGGITTATPSPDTTPQHSLGATTQRRSPPSGPYDPSRRFVTPDCRCLLRCCEHAYDDISPAPPPPGPRDHPARRTAAARPSRRSRLGARARPTARSRCPHGPVGRGRGISAHRATARRSMDAEHGVEPAVRRRGRMVSAPIGRAARVDSSTTARGSATGPPRSPNCAPPPSSSPGSPATAESGTGRRPSEPPPARWPGRVRRIPEARICVSCESDGASGNVDHSDR